MNKRIYFPKFSHAIALLLADTRRYIIVVFKQSPRLQNIAMRGAWAICDSPLGGRLLLHLVIDESPFYL